MKMGSLDRGIHKKRGQARRVEDRILQKQFSQHKQLFRVGQTITSEMNIDALFAIIMDQTNEIMGTERSTVFLIDEEKSELWSLVATGMKKNEIRIPSNHGVAGWVFMNKGPLIINNPYEDERFYSKIDEKTGFRTRNLLCIPLINRKGVCIGALQALNKEAGDFTDDDLDLLTSISHYVAIALENSRLYEAVKNYSEELKATLVRIEMLERIKGQLTKFVPTSVAKMVEKNPDNLKFEKHPMNVTILFIDIQGFSRITENFDQKLVNDMVENHFSRYLECIYRHGGEVNETSGDGLMVIFKDGSLAKNAMKAVAAGMEIVYENRSINEDFHYPWGTVKLHLGINSGEAWVGSTKMKSLTGERWTFTASGLVTVLAARIGALSHESQLYVGEDTYEFVKDFCCTEFIGKKKVKNVSTPIPVYWVKEAQEGHASHTA